jgi:hypothetical protein
MKRVVLFASVVLCSAYLPARAALRQPLLRLRGGVEGLGQFLKVSHPMGDGRADRRGTHFVLGMRARRLPERLLAMSE